jgi:hypothetical protein
VSATRVRTPKLLQKRKLTLREAAEQWVETTDAIAGLKELQKEAADVLIAHVERTSRRTFFNLIAAERSGGSLVMDQAAVRAALPAERFVDGDLMKRSKPGWTLKRLRP